MIILILILIMITHTNADNNKAWSRVLVSADTTLDVCSSETGSSRVTSYLSEGSGF